MKVLERLQIYIQISGKELQKYMETLIGKN
jgi:hypothetical protein